MIKSRKVCFSFFVFFLIPIVLSAKPNFLFDVGRMSFSGIFGDIETSFRPTLTIPEVYFKALSVQADASFDSLKNYKPDFFVTASVDFVLFAGMMGSFFHM